MVQQKDLLKQFFADRAKATRKKQNVLKNDLRRTASANVMLSPIVEIRKKRKSLKPIASAMDIYSSNSRTDTDTMLVSNIGSIEEEGDKKEKTSSKDEKMKIKSTSSASDTDDDDEEVTTFDNLNELSSSGKKKGNATLPASPMDQFDLEEQGLKVTASLSKIASVKDLYFPEDEQTKTAKLKD